MSGLILDRLDKSASGAPVPDKGVFWSVSHKNEWVVGVASLEPVGIDIECIKAVTDSLFKRIVSRNEMELFRSPDQALVFFRVFTAKEAVLKLNGFGISRLSDVSIVSVEGENDLTARLAGQKYRVENFYQDGYLASVTKNGQDVRWISEKLY